MLALTKVLQETLGSAVNVNGKVFLTDSSGRLKPVETVTGKAPVLSHDAAAATEDARRASAGQSPLTDTQKFMMKQGAIKAEDTHAPIITKTDTSVQELRNQPAAGPANVDAAALGAKAAVKTATVENPAKHELMRKTFNALPNKGRDLHIAGKDQTGNINPEHQKQFDTMYKKIAGEQTPGIPGKVAQKAVKTIVAPQDITAGQAAGVLVKKGAHAVGDAAVATGNAMATGAKGIAQHLSEHPLAAAGTLAAGAAGALGLRRFVNRNRPA